MCGCRVCKRTEKEKKGDFPISGDYELDPFCVP